MSKDSLQKWDKWDFKFSTPEASHAAEESREAYKAALRREIEKIGKYKLKQKAKQSGLPSGHLPSYIKGIQEGLKITLQLLDTVEP